MSYAGKCSECDWPYESPARAHPLRAVRTVCDRFADPNSTPEYVLEPRAALSAEEQAARAKLIAAAQADVRAVRDAARDAAQPNSPTKAERT